MSEPYSPAPPSPTRLPELYSASEVRQHIGWLKMFMQDMTAENWRDMKLRAERQLDALSKATESL